MKDFHTIFGSAAPGDWPDTVSKNASGASASDGTPFCKDFIDDLWGWMKRIMFLAGITPAGTADDYTSSQIVDALRRAGRSPGDFCFSAMNATTLALHRIMPLTGQIILITNYPDLCAAVYVGDTYNSLASAFYKCTAGGVASTTGTYMKLPDCRGVFLRGLGTNATLKMANGSFFYGGTYPGDVILDRGHKHWHYVSPVASDSNYIYNGGSGGSYGYAPAATSSAATPWVATNMVSDGSDGPPRTGPETNPVSTASQICIAY